MVLITAITQAITSLSEAEAQFNLRRTEDEQFFTEWFADLPEVAGAEKLELDVIRRRFLYHRIDRDLLEGTVTLLVASPLLELAGFYDPPFKMQAESSVQITLNDGEEVLRGRIDALIMQNQFWVLVLESKETTISAFVALPQALAYIMANPQPDRPVFGLINNGDNIFFVKVCQQPTPQYSLSRVFAPLTSSRELHSVLQILKRIGQAIAPA